MTLVRSMTLERIRARRAAKRRARNVAAWAPVVLAGAACLAIVGGAADILPQAYAASIAAPLALVVVINGPGIAAKTVHASDAMPASACRAALAAIWQAPFPTVGTDAKGRPAPSVDAYCATPAGKVSQ